MAEREGGFPFPYISYATFRNFMLSLNANALPPRIDRSLMLGMAGGTQTHLIQALRVFTLIGENNEVNPPFVAMAGDEETFRAGMRAILMHFYATQLELSERQGTTAQLLESFAPTGYSGSTLRKAVTFFLHAARDADMPLSPHFRPPVATTPVRARRASKPRVAAQETPSMSTNAPAAESHTITLRSGGMVTISCTTTFLALSKDDRDFLFGLVDSLRDYEMRSGTPKDGEH